MVLAEYTEFTGNFPAIAAQCLQKLPSSNNKFTYNCDHHTFNFLVEDGYGIATFFRSLLPLSLFVFSALLSQVKSFSHELEWDGTWIDRLSAGSIVEMDVTSNCDKDFFFFSGFDFILNLILHVGFVYFYGLFPKFC